MTGCYKPDFKLEFLNKLDSSTAKLSSTQLIPTLAAGDELVFKMKCTSEDFSDI